MADGGVDVDALLSAAKAQYKSVEVKKEVDPQLDIGNLLLTDSDPVDIREFKKNVEGYLKALTRENTQLLFNEVWKLPTERFENVIVAQLPKPTTIIPREKPIPKPRPPTKWEEFAKRKGITKRKRERMVYDEVEKMWKPRHGYKRTNDNTQHWVVEVPENADPNEDMFEKRLEAKKERVAKNEFHRLRNIAKGKGKDDLLPSSSPQNKHQLKNAINIARSSTASLGKFQERLPKEKVSKNTGKKRKFEPVVGEFGNERSKSLQLAEKIMKKSDPLDLNKAVNQHMASSERSSENKKKDSSEKGKEKSPAKRGKKGSAGKGKKRGRK